MIVRSFTAVAFSLIFFLFSQIGWGWIDGTPFLKGVKFEADHFTAPTQIRPFRIGDRQNFYAIDFRNESQYIVKSTLRSIGKFCYIFVENGENVSGNAITKIRRAFDEKVPSDPNRGIFQIETDLFGDAPNIDGDDRIFILLLDIRDSARQNDEFIAGYFSPTDQQRGTLNHPNLGIRIHSNEKDLLYIDTDPLKIGSAESLGVIAHECLHLIHNRYDPNEETWIDEGLADFATFLCGYPDEDHLAAFEDRPQTPLTRWADDDEDQLPHYGASFLWTAYLHEHHGGDGFIRSLIQNRTIGIRGVNQTLIAFGSGRTFSAVFADWKITNFLDDETFENGRFGYADLEPQMKIHRRHNNYPIKVDGDLLENHGTHYIQFSDLSPTRKTIITFDQNSRFDFNIRLIFFANDLPIELSTLNFADRESVGLTIENDEKIDQLIACVSLDAPTNVLGEPRGGYGYTAEITDEIEFKTVVIQNPLHSHFWEIFLLPSDRVHETPKITIYESDRKIINSSEMDAISENFVFQLYLPAKTEIAQISWKIQIVNEIVTEGNLDQ